MTMKKELNMFLFHVSLAPKLIAEHRPFGPLFSSAMQNSHSSCAAATLGRGVPEAPKNWKRGGIVLRT